MGEVIYKSADNMHKIFYGYHQNIAFYEHLALPKYEEFAKASGLADREDVLALLPYLNKVKSILEVGAGFGRAVDALLCFCPEAQITALEICPHMCHFMQRRYMEDFNVRVLQADFLCSTLPHQAVELVTLFWSTLSSFSLKEQQQCFHKISNVLAEGGRVVIDLFESSSSKTHQGLKLKSRETKIFTTEVLGRKVFGWLPGDAELLEMARQAGFKLLDQIPYHAHEVKRRFLIFDRA